MSQKTISKTDEYIENLLRNKLHIDIQTEEIMNSLYKQYESQDLFSQLSKSFIEKNKKIRDLEQQNKRLLLENRSLKTNKNFAQLNLSCSPQKVQEFGQIDINQKNSQSLIQKSSFANNVHNISDEGQTFNSLGSQVQKNSLEKVDQMLNNARQQKQTNWKYQDSFLLYLIKTINQLSIKKLEQKYIIDQKDIKENTKNKIYANIQNEPVCIALQNYKRLIQVYCIYTAEKSMNQIIPRQMKSDQYGNKSQVNYKQLLKNLKMQSSDRFQTIFYIIATKLGLSEEWKQFISKKQLQYAQIFNQLAGVVDEKLVQQPKNLEYQVKKLQNQEEQLFDKLTKMVNLNCLKFTENQKQIWKKHVLKKELLNIEQIVKQLNRTIDSKFPYDLAKELNSKMFRRCMNFLWKIIDQNKLSTHRENKISKFCQLKEIKTLDFAINQYISNLLAQPEEKEVYMKKIQQVQNLKFQIVQKLLSKSTYFYSGSLLDQKNKK